MKNYFYILLTILIVIFYKVFLIGILDNETFFIAIIINIVIFSSLILIIPLLLALKSKATYWFNVNKYTKYSLLIFVILFIIPEIYFKYLMSK
jgi:formate hydrogenlyase subunit 4